MSVVKSRKPIGARKKFPYWACGLGVVLLVLFLAVKCQKNAHAVAPSTTTEKGISKGGSTNETTKSSENFFTKPTQVQKISELPVIHTNGSEQTTEVKENVEHSTPERKVSVLKGYDPKKVFTNKIENILEVVSRGSLSPFANPRVDMTDEEVVVFLKEPIDIYEDDDEETVKAKERTAAMKTEALKYIREGGTFNQFLRDYTGMVKEEEGMVNDIKAEMKRILHDEGEDAAQSYLDEVNPRLVEQGLEPVKIGKGTLIMMERQKAKEAKARKVKQAQ